jgi:hypothetical protein
MPPEQIPNQEFNQPKKNNLLTLVIVLLVVFLLAVTTVIYFAVGERAQITEPEPELETKELALDTSDWLTYRNEKIGLELITPEHFSVYQELGFLKINDNRLGVELTLHTGPVGIGFGGWESCPENEIKSLVERNSLSEVKIQCAVLSEEEQVLGSDGRPPYLLLATKTGADPSILLSSRVEVELMKDLNFTETIREIVGSIRFFEKEEIATPILEEEIIIPMEELKTVTLPTSTFEVSSSFYNWINLEIESIETISIQSTPTPTPLSQ